jgi:hypothetical protein
LDFPNSVEQPLESAEKLSKQRKTKMDACLFSGKRTVWMDATLAFFENVLIINNPNVKT